MQKLRPSSEARGEKNALHLQTYNKANRVKAPPRGFEAYKYKVLKRFLLISTPTTQIKLLLKLGKGIHKDIFLDLQSVIGMA